MKMYLKVGLAFLVVFIFSNLKLYACDPIPVAVIHGSETLYACANHPSFFSAEGSYDPDGTVTTYEWKLKENGVYSSPLTVYSEETNLTFTTVGLQEVRLRVKDSQGSWSGYVNKKVLVEEFYSPSPIFPMHDDVATPDVPVSIYSFLNWIETPASAHDVYFGTTSGSLHFQGSQFDSHVDPITSQMELEPNTEYFWQIKESGCVGPKWTYQTSTDALYLDGIDDHILIDGYKGVTGSQSRTITGWIKPEQQCRILGWGDTTNNGNLCQVHLNSGSVGGVYGALSFSVIGGYVIGGRDLMDQQWHHFAVVFDSSISTDVASVKLYVDGQRETISKSLSQTINTSSSNDVTIGDYEHPSGKEFKGGMSDVRIYNIALSDQEIMKLYKGDNPHQQNLQIHLKLNSNTNDISGHGRPTTTYGSPIWNTSNGPGGKVNGSLSMNATGHLESYIDLPYTLFHSKTSAFTISTWIHVNNVSSIMSGVNGANEDAFVFDVNSTGMNLRVSGTDWVSWAAPVSIYDGWHHVSLVVNLPENKVRLYYDGVDQWANEPGGDKVLQNMPSSFDIDSGKLIVGQRFDSTYSSGFTPYYPLRGRIDEFIIHDVALTEEQVSELYTSNTIMSSPPIRAYYSMDGHTRDLSGNGYHGKVMGYNCQQATSNEWRFVTKATNDGHLDEDNDGLTNQEEAILGTNPNQFDSNGNGVQDGWEDSDGDGLSDRWEILNPLHNGYALDPLSNDGEFLSAYNNDNDLNDGINIIEILHNGNINEPNSTLSNITIHVPKDVPSIQQAVDWSIDGDTIVIAPGIYIENIIIGDRAITLQGSSPDDWGVIEKTRITSVTTAPVLVANATSKVSIITGLTFIGSLQENTTTVGCFASLPIIKNNIISGAGYCIQSYSASPKIINNRIFGALKSDNVGAGIHVFGNQNSSLGSLDIKNNMIFSNQIGIHNNLISGIINVVNNTITNNSTCGIYSYSSTIDITNNIIWNPGVPDLLELITQEPILVSYNCIEDGDQENSTNISSDPLFVDAANGDFHLRYDSPCRDKGDNSVVLITDLDIDGANRKGDIVTDMGADEFVIRYVDKDVSSSGTGLSWSQAFKTIPEALSEAKHGDHVWIADGKYTPDNFSRENSIVLKPTIHLYGGFSGDESETFLEHRNWQANETILSGDIASDSPSDNSYHVVIGAEGATLDGFIVEQGFADGVGEYGVGAGLYLTDVSMNIRNTKFLHNYAKNSGANVYCQNSDDKDPSQHNVKFFNCVLAGGHLDENLSNSKGGGLYYTSSGIGDLSVELINSTIADNRQYGIAGDGGHLIANNTILWGNQPDQTDIINSTPLIKYSCIQDAIQNDGNVPFGSGSPNFNIDQDPNFIDPGVWTIRNDPNTIYFQAIVRDFKQGYKFDPNHNAYISQQDGHPDFERPSTNEIAKDGFGNPLGSEHYFEGGPTDPNGVNRTDEGIVASVLENKKPTYVAQVGTFPKPEWPVEYFNTYSCGDEDNDLVTDERPQGRAGYLCYPSTTGEENFNDWYNDVPGVNLKKIVDLKFEKISSSPLVYKHADPDYFPINDKLFGNQDNAKNYHFTTEMHGRFVYHQNNSQYFELVEADDDMWVFINNKLAIDIGGLHNPVNKKVDLDNIANSLGLDNGEIYDFDVFHAERKRTDSHFTLQTNIEFFHSFVAGDYRLQDSSACINAGDTSKVSVLDKDLASLDRTVGTVDIGAFENQATNDNQDPNVEAGNDITIMLSQSVDFYINGANVSDDNKPDPPNQLTYLWSKLTGPGNVIFVNRYDYQTTATFTQTGEYTLQLYASDGSAEATDTVIVTVTEDVNEPPVIVASDYSQDWLGTPVNIIMGSSATDDGLPTSPLTYTWKTLNKTSDSNVSYNPGLDSENPTVTFDQPGLYKLRFTVSDGEYSPYKDINVTLNQKPAVYAGGDRTMTIGTSPITIYLQDSNVEDFDGLPNANVDINWSVNQSSGLTFEGLDGSKLENPTIKVFSSGVYTLTLTANDGSEDVSDSVKVTVEDAQPEAVIVEAGEQDEITLPIDRRHMFDARIYGGTPEDWDNSKWTLLHSPPGSAINFINGTTEHDPNATIQFSHQGDYLLQLGAYKSPDPAAIASDTILVKVVPGIGPGQQNEPVVEAFVNDSNHVLITTDSASTTVDLTGIITDDGMPFGTIDAKWQRMSGPLDGYIISQQSKHYSNITSDSILTPSTQATFTKAGDYRFRLVADDGELTGHDDISVKVNMPTIDAGEDQTIMILGIAELKGTVSDLANGKTEWSFDGPEGLVTFHDPNIFIDPNIDTDDLNAYKRLDPYAKFTEPGEYELKLTATYQPNNISISDTVIVTVKERPKHTLAAGRRHSLILDPEGRVWAAGQNRGINPDTLVDEVHDYPTFYVPPDTNNLQNLVNSYVYSSSTLGIGENNSRERFSYVPVVTSSLFDEQNIYLGFGTHFSEIQQISSGAYFSIALDPNGNVWSWGNNRLGELGNNADLANYRNDPINDMDHPVRVHAGDQDPLYDLNTNLTYLDNIITISAASSGRYSYYRSSSYDNPLYNTYNSTIQFHYNMLYGFHALALDNNGQVWSWGSNLNYELGNNTGFLFSSGLSCSSPDCMPYSSVPVQVVAPEPFSPELPLTNIIDISAGAIHNLALNSRGQVYSWGFNGKQSGNLGGGGKYTRGYIANGVLGIGLETSNIRKDRPVFVKAPMDYSQPEYGPYLKDIYAIDAGMGISIVATKTGEVFVWGGIRSSSLKTDDFDEKYAGVSIGRLGDTINNDSSIPIRVVGPDVDSNGDPDGYLSNIISVAAGWNHFLALDRDGFVWAWGDSLVWDSTGPIQKSNGVMGQGNPKRHIYPIPVKIRAQDANGDGLPDDLNHNGDHWDDYLKDIVEIEADSFHNLAKDIHGNIFAWGAQPFGELGVGDTEVKYLPTPVKIAPTRIHNSTQNIWYHTIQFAINDANANDEIVVFPGTYYENITINKPITLRSADPNEADIVSKTIIDGSGRDFPAVIAQVENNTVTLDGFTITAGAINQDTENFSGSPISCGGGQACLRGNGLSRSLVRVNVGVLCHESTILVLKNCEINENQGGVFYFLQDPGCEIVNCTIAGNQLYGIKHEDNLFPVTIRDSIIWGNGDNSYQTNINDPDNQLAENTITYCNIGGIANGVTNINQDPNFVHTYDSHKIIKNSSSDGTVTLEDISTAGNYSLGNIVEISNDGISRRIVEIEIDSFNNEIDLKVEPNINELGQLSDHVITTWGLGYIDSKTDEVQGVNNSSTSVIVESIENFQIGDQITFDHEPTMRRVTYVDAETKTITFTPKYIINTFETPPVAGKKIYHWGKGIETFNVDSDYRLQHGSPGINVGTGPAGEHDVAKELRELGTRVDMGAYEFPVMKVFAGNDRTVYIDAEGSIKTVGLNQATVLYNRVLWNNELVAPAPGTMKYQWSVLEKPQLATNVFAIGQETQLDPQALFDRVGKYRLMLTVFEDYGGSVGEKPVGSDFINITVKAGLDVDAGGDQTIVYPNKATLISSENGSSDMQWTYIGAKKSGVVIATPELSQTDVTFDSPGVYEFKLAVLNPARTEELGQDRITVFVNHPDIRADVGENITLSAPENSVTLAANIIGDFSDGQAGGQEEHCKVKWQLLNNPSDLDVVFSHPDPNFLPEETMDPTIQLFDKQGNSGIGQVELLFTVLNSSGRYVSSNRLWISVVSEKAIDAGSDQQLASPYVATNLLGRLQGDFDVMTEWVYTGNPSDVTIGQPSKLQTWVKFNNFDYSQAPKRYTFNLIVKKDNLIVGIDSVDVQLGSGTVTPESGGADISAGLDQTVELSSDPISLNGLLNSGIVANWQWIYEGDDQWIDISEPTSPVTDITLKRGGIHNFTLVAMDSSGAILDTDSVTISTSLQQAKVHAEKENPNQPDFPILSGSLKLIGSIVSGSPASVSWSYDGGSGVVHVDPNSIDPNIAHATFDIAGKYHLTFNGHDVLGNVIARDSVVVTAKNMEFVSDAGPNLKVTLPSGSNPSVNAILQGSIIGDSTNVSQTWHPVLDGSIGVHPGIPASEVDKYDPNITFTEPGIFYFKLELTNTSNGQSNSDVMRVTVFPHGVSTFAKAGQYPNIKAHVPTKLDQAFVIGPKKNQATFEWSYDETNVPIKTIETDSGPKDIKGQMKFLTSNKNLQPEVLFTIPGDYHVTLTPTIPNEQTIPDAITINIKSYSSDWQPPVIQSFVATTISQPVPTGISGPVTEDITIEVIAEDNVALNKIQVYLNDVAIDKLSPARAKVTEQILVGTKQAPRKIKQTIQLPIHSLDNGNHTLSVFASDQSDNGVLGENTFSFSKNMCISKLEVTPEQVTNSNNTFEVKFIPLANATLNIKHPSCVSGICHTQEVTGDGLLQTFQYDSTLMNLVDGSYTAEIVCGNETATIGFKVIKGSIDEPTANISNMNPVDNGGPGSAPIEITRSPIIIKESLFEVLGSATHNIFPEEVKYRIYVDNKNVTPGILNNFGWRNQYVDATTGNSLGTIDLTGFENGLHTLTLDVQIYAGGQITVAEEVQREFVLQSDLKIGQVKFSQEDLTIPVNGVPLRVVRTYDSLRKDKHGDFGYGWTYSIANMDIEMNEVRFPAKDTGEGTIRRGSPFNRDVNLTLPDGRRKTFRSVLKSGVLPPVYGGSQYSHYRNRLLYIDADDMTPSFDVNHASSQLFEKFKTTDGLTLIDGGGGYGGSGLQWVTRERGIGSFDPPQDQDTSMDYGHHDPAGFIYTDDDGTAYTIDRKPYGIKRKGSDDYSGYKYFAAGQPYVSSVKLATGESLSFDVDVTDGENPIVKRIDAKDVFGNSVAHLNIERKDGRITAIYAPGDTPGEPSLQYLYDSYGNLTHVKKLVDPTKTDEYEKYDIIEIKYSNEQFGSEDHYVTDIKDERGLSPIRYEYDPAGRLQATIDAQGNRIEIQHDLEGKTETVTDRNNNVTSYTYDEKGNVKVVSKHDGTGQINTFYDYTYAGNGVDISETKTRQSRYYDAKQDHADPNFIINITRNDDNGRMSQQIDPMHNVITFEYDSDNNVTRTIQWKQSSGASNEFLSTYEPNPSSPPTGYEVVQVTTNSYENKRLKETKVFGPTDFVNEIQKTSNTYTDDYKIKTVMQHDIAGTDHMVTTYHYDEAKSRSSQQPYWVQTNNDPKQYSYYDANGHLVVSWTHDKDKDGIDVRILNLNDLDHQGRILKTRRIVETYVDENTYDFSNYLNGSDRFPEPYPACTGSCVSSELLSETIYNDIGQVEKTYDQYRGVTEYYYDKLGNTVEVATREVDGGAVKTVQRTLYDKSGRVIVSGDPHSPTGRGTATQTKYDDLGRVQETIRWDNVVIVLDNLYDEDSQLIGKTSVRADGLAATDTQQAVWLSSSGSDYNILGQVERSYVTDEEEVKRYTQYQYDNFGRQTETIDALGFRTVTGYDGNQRDHVIDARGNVAGANADNFKTQFVYDELGRGKETVLPSRESYDDTLTTKSSKESRTHVSYDSFGRQYQTSDLTIATAIGSAVHKTFGYDANGRLATVTLPQVDDPENSNTPTHPACNYIHDTAGNQVAIVDPKGRVRLFEYNEFHAQTRMYEPYLPASPVVTLQDALDELAGISATVKFQQTDYDTLGRVTKVTKMDGQYITYHYYGANITGGKLGQLKETLYYDSGHVLKDKFVNTYDNFGRQDTIERYVDGSATVTHTTDYDYNGRGELIKVTSDEGVIEYGYYNTGRKQWTRTANSEVHFTYDELGRLKEVRDVMRDGQSVDDLTQYTYDEVGNRATIKYANGIESTYTYDALNSLDTLVHNKDTTQLANYDYDVYVDGMRAKSAEQVRSVNDVMDTYHKEFEYDNLNRLTQEKSTDQATGGKSYTANYTYDLVGNRLSHAVNVNGVTLTTKYCYNDKDQLVSEVKDPAHVCGNTKCYPTYVADSGVDGGGSIVWKTLPSRLLGQGLNVALGLVSFAFLFALLRTVLLSHCQSSSRVPAFYRGLAAMLAMTFVIGPGSFQLLADNANIYEELVNRYEEIWGENNTKKLYSYNANGEMDQMILADKDEADPDNNFIEKVLYDYNSQGRMERVTRQHKEDLDADPELDLVEDITEYTYNHRGIRVTETYIYKIDGVIPADTGYTKTFLVDEHNHTGYAQVFEENLVDHNGSQRTSYTIGDDVLSQSSSGTVQYLLCDGHGSTRQLANQTLVDDNVVITQTFDYDAYGVNLDTTTPETDLLYAGEYYDSNAEQYYNRARWYNQNNGRFNRYDPFAGNNRDPLSLHKYTFAHGNPVNMIDPTGLFAIVEVLVALTAITTIAAIFVPPLMRVYRSITGIYDLTSFTSLVRGLANKGFMSYAEAQGIQHEAFLAAREMINDAVGATKEVVKGIIEQYIYGLAFAAVTRGMAFAASTAVKVVKAGSVSIALGDRARKHHTVFKAAVKPFRRQRLYVLPHKYHVGAPDGLHYKILNSQFSHLHPSNGRTMKSILRSMGKQKWLDELGDCYKWLESKWPEQYKGIYECYQKAVKSVGGIDGLR